MLIPVSPALQSCIDKCLQCYRICTQMASLHCLQIGGEHSQPGHIRTMLECAEACRVNAHFMLLNGAFARALGSLCADACRACAESCSMLEGMSDCIDICERTAACCETVVGDPTRAAA